MERKNCNFNKLPIFENTNDWLNYNYIDYYNDNKELIKQYNIPYNESYNYFLKFKYTDVPHFRTYKAEQNFLYEGLSYSYDIDKLKNILKNKFDNVLGVEYDNTHLLEIYTSNIDNIKEIENILDFYGYFIAKYDKNIGYYKILGESKFGLLEVTDSIYKEKNGIVYHLTDYCHINKILKNGLVPKHKDKWSPHPDRIYLLIDNNKQIINLLIEQMGYYKEDKHPVLLKIDLKKNPIGTIRLFEDQMFSNDEDIYGIFTAENIHPQCIIDIIDLKNGNQK